MSRLSSMKPKDNGWGVEAAISDAAEQVRDGRKSPMIPVIGAIDIKELKIDPTTGEHTAVVQIRRLNTITDSASIREAQRMIMREVANLAGPETMLPFEEKDILERAFGGMTGKTAGEQLVDDEERDLDETLDDEGRLRRHLVAVHDVDPNWALNADTETADVARTHDEFHASDPSDRVWPDHDPESVAWRRVDLAEMLGEAEEPAGTDQTTLYEINGAITDDPNPHPLPGEDNPLIPEFDGGAFPASQEQADTEPND